MAVTTDITALSTTAANNSPTDTEQRTLADDYFRQIHAFIATLYADKAALVSPAFTGTPTTSTLEIGYRKIVRVASTGETLAATMVGKCVSTSGNMTVPNSTMAAGDAISFYNSGATTLTFTQGSGVTLRIAGTTYSGHVKLAPYGLATIWFDTTSVAVMGGNVLAA